MPSITRIGAVIEAYARRVQQTLVWAGSDYPIVFVVIADIAMVGCLLAVVVEAAMVGVSGWGWLAVAAFVGLSLVPVAMLLVRRYPWLHGLMVFHIAAVLVLWLQPVELELSPLILVLAGTMLGAVCPPRSAVWDLCAATAVILVGTEIGRIPHNQLYITMLWFGGVVAALLRAQMLIARKERQARASETALERAAIAREVHDVVAHSLAVVLLNVTGARRALDEGDSAEAADALGDAERAGRAAMTDIRRTIDLLRTDPSVPGDAQPTVDDVEDLIASLRRAGTDISLDGGPAGITLTGAGGLAADRIVQESLSNAIWHAPGMPIHVHMGTVDGRDAPMLVIDVSNPMVGSHHSVGTGLGITGMIGRAEQLGGQVAVAGPLVGRRRPAGDRHGRGGATWVRRSFASCWSMTRS